MSDASPIDAMLAAVRDWLATLPAGVAEMRESRPNAFEVVLDIRATRAPHAAPFTLRLGRDGTFDVAAGEGAQFDELSPDEYDIAVICDGIVSGGLTEEVERCQGTLVASRAQLAVRGETLHCDRRQLGPRLRAAVQGGGERTTVRYAPYDPALAGPPT